MNRRPVVSQGYKKRGLVRRGKVLESLRNSKKRQKWSHKLLIPGCGPRNVRLNQGKKKRKWALGDRVEKPKGATTVTKEEFSPQREKGGPSETVQEKKRIQRWGNQDELPVKSAKPAHRTIR